MDSTSYNQDRKVLSWTVTTPGGTVHRTYIEGPPGFEVKSKPDGRFKAIPPSPSLVTNRSWNDDLGLKVQSATTSPCGTHTSNALQAPEGYKVHFDPHGYTTAKLSNKWKPKPTDRAEGQSSTTSTSTYQDTD